MRPPKRPAWSMGQCQSLPPGQELGGTGECIGSAEVQLGVRLGGSAGRWRGRAELRREERRSGATMLRLLAPPSDLPKAHGWHYSPLWEDWGQVWGARHRCDGAYRPEAGGCQVWRALPAACAILPATWKGPAAQPSSLHKPPSPFPAPAPALTSQWCFRRGAGDQAGPGHKARRGEGWRGWRWQLLQRQSQEGWEKQGGRPPTSGHGTRRGGCPTPRGRGDLPATDLPSCSLAPSELLHYQGGEDTDTAVEVACPEAIVHLAGGTGQHPDDGPLGEAQLLRALSLVVIQGSHQPGCGEDEVRARHPQCCCCRGSASPRHQPCASVPSAGEVTPRHPPPGSRTSSAAMMLESWRCRAEGPGGPGPGPSSPPRDSRYFSGT